MGRPSASGLGRSGLIPDVCSSPEARTRLGVSQVCSIGSEGDPASRGHGASLASHPNRPRGRAARVSLPAGEAAASGFPVFPAEARRTAAEAKGRVVARRLSAESDPWFVARYWFQVHRVPPTGQGGRAERNRRTYVFFQAKGSGTAFLPSAQADSWIPADGGGICPAGLG